MIENRQFREIIEQAFNLIGQEGLVGRTDCDQSVESFIFDQLKNLGHDMKIVSEEYGTYVLGEPEITVIVDPIDGSGNLLRGIPIYAVALAVCEGSLDRVSLNDIRYSVIATVFGVFENSREDEMQEQKECTIHNQEALLRCYARDFRMRLLGASTVELCLLAEGSLDGFIEIKGLKSVDLIPTLLILKKHSCFFSDKAGKELVFPLDDPKKNQFSFVAARNKELHQDLLALIEAEEKGADQHG